MTATIFPRLSVDRARSRWEDHLYELTPVEERSPGRSYKREDYFAPLGYGGINGAKLRQLIHLVDRYVNQGGRSGILTGASVLSPQVSMGALVARHYGLPCRVVLGASSPSTCIRHENVAIAADVGADFTHVPVGFNPALQRAVSDLHAAQPDWYRLCYGITTDQDAADEEIAWFHGPGAAQAANLPDDTDTLVMPAGSCNSCTSVLIGLAQKRPAALRRVVLVGVGPTRLQWLEDRLAAVERATGLTVRSLFRRRYHHQSALEHEHQTDGPILLEHYDLHATKYATYGDRMPATLDGIDFHPTYEGKVIRYMAERPSEFSWFLDPDDPVVFWIVGSAPSRRAMSGPLLLDGIAA